MPYLLANFHTLANAVVEEGEHRGFIDISVWRRSGDNKPHNARIMENHLPFAWFYCAQRSWNPYYAHPAVRVRLEASTELFMSPVGYFYEANGPDWGYNMGTEHSNIRMSAHYTQGTPFEELFVSKLNRWYDWLSYNALPEPGSRHWVMNHAIGARTYRGSRSALRGGAAGDGIHGCRPCCAA